MESPMRCLFVSAMVLFAAMPAAGNAAPAPRPVSDIERTLKDPATAQRIDRAMESMTDALLDMKVGPLKAAAEGREPTADERGLTVREMERRSGRDPEAVRRQIREAGPAIARGMNALADALPKMTRALDDARRTIERAAANMPDPTYPKR
jgi:hypothetical protein